MCLKKLSGKNNTKYTHMHYNSTSQFCKSFVYKN